MATKGKHFFTTSLIFFSKRLLMNQHHSWFLYKIIPDELIIAKPLVNIFFSKWPLMVTRRQHFAFFLQNSNQGSTFSSRFLSFFSKWPSKVNMSIFPVLFKKVDKSEHFKTLSMKYFFKHVCQCNLCLLFIQKFFSKWLPRIIIY